MSGRLREDRPADGVLRLVISHPEKSGALDHAILDAIAERLRGIESDPRTRCVLLTGEPGTFSSGYDIGDIPDAEFAVRAEALVAHPFTSAIDALDACDLPVLAALGGPAIGGGLELALACDLRLAAHDVRLGMPPARLGLVYSHTGLRRFVDVIGSARTRELFLLAREIDAAQAEAWGLVNRVVPAADLAQEALDWAAALAAGAPLSVRGTKRILRALLAAEGALPAATADELIALRRACFDSADLREGVRAFAEKRTPRWTGR